MSTDAHMDRRPRNRLLMLAIASVASVVAAVIASKVSDGGGVIEAAITPVIVAVVTDVLSPIVKSDERPPPTEQAASTRRFPVGALLAAIVIGLVAFVIAAVALTLPEVIVDKSITGESGRTSYFGNNADTPWGEALSWSECFDDIETCVRDIIDTNR